MAEESKRADEPASAPAAACSPRSAWDWIDASLLIGMAAQFTATYNFTDSSIAVDLMARDGLTAPGWATSALYGSIFAGTILGQLTMGFLGDVLGRGAALAITFSITATGAVLSGALAVGSPLASYASVTAWRFVVGVGIGGVPAERDHRERELGGRAAPSPSVDDDDDGECCGRRPLSTCPRRPSAWAGAYFGQVRAARASRPPFLLLGHSLPHPLVRVPSARVLRA